MLTFCHNEQSSSRGFETSLRPRLTFICQAKGAQAAIPRVMHKHHDRFELMFIRAGSGVYNIDGQSYSVKKGDMIVFNANVLHDETPMATEDLLIYSCGVEQLKVDGLPMNVLTSRTQSPVISCGEFYDEIAQLFDQMWSHVSRRRLYSSEIGDNLLGVLLLIFRDLWLEHKSEQETSIILPGQRVKEYIDNHYKEDIALVTMATKLNMNQFYLSHSFKDYSGYSPKQYQTRRRIGEAQNLLLSTGLGITEIANAVGYDNVNNFHRIFQNLVGIPPARYKKFWLRGISKA
jgi:AraC-like DNA-binding protein/mannose-6-phosphate isomerase-like protein (cupin superfamily)